MRLPLLLLTTLPAAAAAPPPHGGAAPAAAEPKVVEVPRGDPAKWSEIRTQPGRLLVLAAEPASKWLLVDEDGADLRAFDAGKLAAFVAPAAGRFKAIVTAPDGTAARVVVVVGEGPDPPPQPKPPADPLRAKLEAAFKADKGDDEAAKDLGELYRQLASLVAKDEVATAGDLVRRARDAAAVLIGADVLVGVRRVVSAELAAIIPADGPLDADRRKRLAELFARLATILDEIGGGK